MKKIIALVLSVVLICCCSLTAFAADSPIAESKITIIIRRGKGWGSISGSISGNIPGGPSGEITGGVIDESIEGVEEILKYEADIKYTVEKDNVITVNITKEHEDKHGNFREWKIYKLVEIVMGVSAPVNPGLVTLNAATNLVTKTKVVEAVEGVDYEIISGSRNSEEMKIKLNTSVIVCANYDEKLTNPVVDSNVDAPFELDETGSYIIEDESDESEKAPQTSDMTVVYASIIMLAVVVFGFGVKKVYSK